jgi:uncharacterized membrane protein
MLSVLPSVLLIAIAGSGFALSAYIHSKKRAQQALVCPLKADCESVIHSEFSRFFGIPVELLGMAFYGIVAASYAGLLAVPTAAVPPVLFFLLVITAAGFLFSLYLIFIQAFTLKQWCSWCLISEGLCTAIFLLVASSSALGLLPLLAHNRELLVAIHLFGLVLGLGGATITDILFFRFLRDWRITSFEADVMRTLSQVIWLGLAILVLSGLGIYLPQAVVLNSSTKFLVKVVAVIIIIVNGAFLNLKISPHLISFSFTDADEGSGSKMVRLRRLSFALGAVSVTSWYTAFLLGMVRSVPIGFRLLLLLYVAALVMAIAGSQLVERRLVQRAAQ